VCILFFLHDDGDGEGREDDENEDVRGRVALNDPWWDDKISDDEDVFEVDYDVNRAGPSTYECVEGDGENGNENENENEDGDGDGSGDEDEDGFEGVGVEGRSGPSTSQGRSGPSTSDHDMQSFEDVEMVDNDSEMGRSDILLSPPISDDDFGGISSNLGLEFHVMAYAPIIYPVPSEEQWIRTHHGVLEPPRLRVTLGRPRKARTRAPDESRDPKNPHRMRKFG
jgi:hypothetical protein